MSHQAFEVVSGGTRVGEIRRRRRWTRAEKLAIVRESHEAGTRVEDVARRHNVARSHLSLWRSQAAMGTLTLSPASNEQVSVSEHRALQQQVQELQRLLGRKTLEAEYLRCEIEAAQRAPVNSNEKQSA